MFFFQDIFFIEKVRKKIFFLFLAYPPPQIDVQREIKADVDFLCQFLPEFNISMDPSDVLCNVLLSEVDIIMDRKMSFFVDGRLLIPGAIFQRLITHEKWGWGGRRDGMVTPRNTFGFYGVAQAI